MLTRLSLRKALELIGMDLRAFWGVQPITPDRIFWPTVREAPEGKPTRLEFQRAVEAVERMVVGSDNIWVTSPTIERLPEPKAFVAGNLMACWSRRAMRLAIDGERKYEGQATLTPLNDRVLIDWVNVYQQFLQGLECGELLLQELVISCPNCREEYAPFPILAHVGPKEVSLIADPWEILSPSIYADVRGPVSSAQANWGTVDVWGYVGKKVEFAGELSATDAKLTYSGIERPEIWLRIVAGYTPNVCASSNLFRFWAQVTEPLSITGWGATVGAIEAWAMRSTIRE